MMAESAGSECNNLFSSLEPGKNERSRELLRIGLSHQDDGIRGSATFFLDRLPRGEAVHLLREKLRDPSADVRKEAILNVCDLYSKADESWLKEVANAEASDSNRKLLLEKIGELE
ncbi:MAG: hypothetical protein EOP85_19295 [Verrucomicrobiaceae bacterium]|nr:MAG: hypothetical protein EOP85_19295 [Verrucomicrobiaceae bacterium]